MRVRKYRYFAADFETTVYDGQQSTEVWAAACVELYSDEVNVFHSIEELFYYFRSIEENLIVYFHNLKFDGSFWIYYLLYVLEYKQAFQKVGSGLYDVEWLTEKDMPNNSFKYSISDRGQWYNIIIKTGRHVIELRDSLKLLPFSLERIGESFDTPHKKLSMEYKGFRFAGCEITNEEKRYIENDVLVLKDALEIMFNEGHKKLTIGACCLNEFKTIVGKPFYEKNFPILYDVRIDPNRHYYDNAGEYIRKSYKGGWCYLVKGKENKIFTNGTTADVNSLYPSVMSSESGNKYPVGLPKFWTGNYIPDECEDDNTYYFIRIKTRFHVKHGFLPFIQIKGSFLYQGTECLETSDVYDKKTGKYYSQYTDFSGNVCDTRVELTMTMTDYSLFLKHYDVEDFEILDGCYFTAVVGIFDDYIEKYKKIKLENKGAKRELAKLFLNNLYGKMSSNTDSSFKVAYLKEDGSLGYVIVDEHKKKPGYIAVGSAITSYARCFTITAAQQNYHGQNKAGFIYADTDSIHCDLEPNKIQGITLHDKNFCCWKLESQWDKAIFVRQKTYIEHVVGENCTPIDNPYFNVKCAGLPDRCKNLFVESLDGTADERRLENDVVDNEKTRKKYTPEEKDFLFDKNGEKIIRDMTDFKRGLKVPGKLIPHNIRGGIVLMETTYEIK